MTAKELVHIWDTFSSQEISDLPLTASETANLETVIDHLRFCVSCREDFDVYAEDIEYVWQIDCIEKIEDWICR